MRSPTARTLSFLRGIGATAEVVEHWIPMTAAGFRGPLKRKDVFDCIDILCVQGAKLLGIQSTSGANHGSRITKALGSDKLRAFVATGNGFEVWSWSKKGPRGKRKLWTPRVTQLVIQGDKLIVL